MNPYHDHPASPYHDHTDRYDQPVVEAVTLRRVTFLRGIGCCQASPARRVTAYYTDDGELLFEQDPMAVAS